MNKAFNHNFILAIILSLALMLVPLGIGIIVYGIEKDVQEIENKLEMLEEEEPGSTEEFELGIEVYLYGKVLFFFVLFIIGGYALLLFLTAFSAWMIYRKNSKRLLAYRVIMSVNYLLQAGVIYVLVDMLVDQFSMIVLILTILVVVTLIYSAFNTYTKRICRIA